jgi:histidinol phosphatase-like PHP family hydrolase
VLLTSDQQKLIKIQKRQHVVEAESSATESDDNIKAQENLVKWLVYKEKTTGPLTLNSDSKVTQKLAYGVYGKIMVDKDDLEILDSKEQQDIEAVMEPVSASVKK